MGDKGRTRRVHTRRGWGFNQTLFFMVNGKAFSGTTSPAPPPYVRSANKEGEVNGEFKLIHHHNARMFDLVEGRLLKCCQRILRSISLAWGFCVFSRRMFCLTAEGHFNVLKIEWQG